jgi:hypothetical protein
MFIRPHARFYADIHPGARPNTALGVAVEIRWDEKAGLPEGMQCTLPSYRRARSTDKKETGNEEG